MRYIDLYGLEALEYWWNEDDDFVYALPDGWECVAPMPQDKFSWSDLEPIEFDWSDFQSVRDGDENDDDKGQGEVWSAAIGLTKDWVLGTGADNHIFNNDAIANSFRNARVINQARDYWYNQVNTGKKTINDGVTNFLGRKAWTGGNFGIKGLIAAGLDPIEQFVGSFTTKISSDGHNLTFTIQNTTSFRSLMYGIAPDWPRSTWGPGGNMSQTYIFTEPINFNRIK